MSTITYKKVSDLLEAQSLNLTDYIPIVSDGTNYKITVETLVNAIGSGGSGVMPITSELNYNSNLISITISPINGQIGE